MRGVLGAKSWERLVKTVARLKPETICLEMRTGELILSATREPISVSVRIPVKCSEMGSVKLPSKAVSGIGSPEDVRLNVSHGRFSARSGERVIRSQVIAGAVPKPIQPVSGEQIPVKTILQAFSVAGAARVAEKGAHSKDAAPFQLLSVNRVRTVAGQPGGKSTAIGPGIPSLDASPIHFPLGSVAVVASHLTGLSGVKIRSIGSKLIISGDGLVIAIQLQPGETTPLDGPVDLSFFDAVKAHGTESSLLVSDGITLSKSFPGPILNDATMARALDDSFETPSPDGWPVGCFDSINLVRCARAVADPSETVQIVSSPKFALITGSRGVAMVLGRVEGL